MNFKVASFNVNSIRSRKEMLLEWLQENKPDVICLQETKVMDADFPEDYFKPPAPTGRRPIHFLGLPHLQRTGTKPRLAHRPHLGHRPPGKVFNQSLDRHRTKAQRKAVRPHLYRSEI